MCLNEIAQLQEIQNTLSANITLLQKEADTITWEALYRDRGEDAESTDFVEELKAAFEAAEFNEEGLEIPDFDTMCDSRLEWTKDKIAEAKAEQHELQEWRDYLLDMLADGQPEIIAECEPALQDFLGYIYDWQESKSESQTSNEELLKDLYERSGSGDFETFVAETR